MPLPAASDTMMVTGRLGYCAWATRICASAKPSANAADIATRSIASLPVSRLGAQTCVYLSCAGSTAHPSAKITFSKMGRRVKPGNDGKTLRRFRRRHRQHRIKRVRIARLAQAGDGFRVAQQPRDAGERLEVIGARRFRREQQENQIHRLAIERLKIDRPIEARKQAYQFLQLRQLAVRDRNAVADAGAAELLTLH